MTLSEATILVVDDEPMLRQGYATWLKRAGCKHVVTAANGQEAFEIFLAAHIDMVVSDVRMPVMDGIGLLENIYHSGKEAPVVIFVSGFSNIEIPVAYDMGVEAFLAKPFSAATLVGTVTKSLASRAELWSSPMSPAPVSQLVLTAFFASPATQETTAVHQELRFGRGGFSCHQTEPVPLAPLRFALSTKEQAPPIEGHGFVRWFSRETQRVGIEIHYLAPDTREAALARVEARSCNSFIPL